MAVKKNIKRSKKLKLDSAVKNAVTFGKTDYDR